MSKGKQVIEDPIKLLHAVRMEIQSDVEDSVVEQLDMAIQKLEIEISQKSGKISDKDKLVFLGHIIGLIPEIPALIEFIKTW